MGVPKCFLLLWIEAPHPIWLKEKQDFDDIEVFSVNYCWQKLTPPQQPIFKHFPYRQTSYQFCCWQKPNLLRRLEINVLPNFSFYLIRFQGCGGGNLVFNSLGEVGGIRERVSSLNYKNIPHICNFSLHMHNLSK